MIGCTFFGSRNLSENVEQRLRKVIIGLIEENGVDCFYVGTQGNFDFLVIRVLNELNKVYFHIKVVVVLAYMPNQNENYDWLAKSVYPSEVADVPYRYRIHKRNCLMLEKSEYVVTCVKNAFGGAAKFKAMAERKGKTVIDV